MRPRAIVGISLGLLVLGWSRLPAAEKLPPTAEWIPQGALLSVEITQTKPVLDLLLDEQTTAAVTSVPELKQALASPQFAQFRAVVAYLEATLSTDWKTAVRKLVGGISLTVYPSGGALLTVDAQDAELLKRLHDILLQFAKEKAGQSNRVVSNEYQGVTAWTFGADEVHTLIDNRLLIANRPAILKAALDLRATANGKSLAASPAYQNARKAVEANALGMALVNMEMLKQNPGIKNVLAADTNPLATFLFADVAEALRDATWLVFGLQVKADTLALHALTDSKPGESSTAAFAVPAKPTDGTLANLSVPRTIAAISLYRDLHGFYAAKDKLFPNRTSGLIFFENMMGIFFTGRDLTDEVLAELKPGMRIVVAEQQYDAKSGTPRVKFPTFAAIFRSQHPEKFRDVAEEAWQKALGLINFTRGQKAEPGLILDRPVHSKIQFTASRFPMPTEKELQDADVRFNFRPALAMLGDYVVLSSTEALARDLIDALQAELAKPIKPLAGTNSLVELEGDQLASILTANRENLVRNNMLEKGHAQEQAGREIDLLLTLVKLVGKTKLEIGTRDGQTKAQLEVQLKLK
ncbi:MAG: DUF3352 domain-containing protein [Planctomycetota bacterium]|nr:DUF3352 domain-containing protein [Planctomycetota bacterium]